MGRQCGSGFLVGPTLYTSCVSMTGSHINNVKTPAGLFGSNLVFSGNQLDHFGDDGIDYGASYLTITKNYIHDNLNIGDGNHEDAMQGYAAKLPAGVTVADYEHILIDSNTIIRQTDAHLQFPTYLQGIDAFDQEWSHVTVRNNVVITSACWGIVFSSIHNSTIANNTAVSDGLIVVPGCVPAVGVGDKTHQGDSSSNTVVRNNLANEIFVDNLDPGVEMDHNVGMTPGAELSWYVNGGAQYLRNPGTYSNGVNVANIIAAGGPATEFVEFDPSTLSL